MMYGLKTNRCQGDITFGGVNRIVRFIERVSLRGAHHLWQEFMQDGDPENLIHKSQGAIVAFEM